ncbi:MAG: type II toxin-antitoxin system VapC family toxin [Chloroflexia bacterium]
MTQYILDTDHVSPHQRGHRAVQRRLARMSMDDAADDLATTVNALEEQVRGRFATLHRHVTTPQQIRQELNAYADFLSIWRYFQLLTILPFDQPASDRFRQLRQQGLRIGSQDLRIAAIALSIGATVVTRNSRDFSRVPGLLLEDWSVSE